MDKLEKFIIDQRDDFDDAVPNAFIWNAIDEALTHRQAPLSVASVNEQKKHALWRFLRYAAAAILLIGVGIVGALWVQSNPNNRISNRLDSEKGIKLKDISPEYAEVEQFYTRKIAQQTKQLRGKEYDTSINSDLQQIDEVMAELQVEMENAPRGSREKIISTMITNYKSKMELLEKILTQENTPSINHLNNNNNNINKNEKGNI